MYSRYSASREQEASPTLPARYSGVRFRREKRSDGRDIVIEAPMKEPEPVRNEAVEEAAPQKRERGAISEKLSSLFGAVGEDDIILAALIIVLAGEGVDGSREAVLLLIFLLCIR